MKVITDLISYSIFGKQNWRCGMNLHRKNIFLRMIFEPKIYFQLILILKKPFLSSVWNKLSIVSKTSTIKSLNFQRHLQFITVLNYYTKMSMNNVLHANAATIDAHPFCANGILTDWIRKETELRGMMKTSKF